MTSVKAVLAGDLCFSVVPMIIAKKAKARGRGGEKVSVL